MVPKETRKRIHTNTNAELRAMFNESDTVGIVESRSIRGAGNVWRAEGQTLREITIWKSDKKKPNGRPRQRWIDRVREHLKLLGMRDEEQLAKDRKAWRGVVEAAIGLQDME